VESSRAATDRWTDSLRQFVKARGENFENVGVEYVPRLLFNVQVKYHL